jgi:uncharacterized protein (DUF1778 family)
MPKTESITFRVDAETKEAIENAAREDGRAVSNLLDRIVSEWLRRRQSTKEKEE